MLALVITVPPTVTITYEVAAGTGVTEADTKVVWMEVGAPSDVGDPEGEAEPSVEEGLLEGESVDDGAADVEVTDGLAADEVVGSDDTGDEVVEGLGEADRDGLADGVADAAAVDDTAAAEDVSLSEGLLLSCLCCRLS